MKTLLFNPGPTNTSQETKSALACKDMCHREAEFSEILKRSCKNLVKAFEIEDGYSAVLFACSATGCNEAMIACVHGKILLINNGKYSERLGKIASRFKIPMTEIIMDSFEFDLHQIEQILIREKDITHILFVHHETTTSALAPIEEICALAKKYNKKTLIDTVSSLGGHYIDIKGLGITFCTVSANKCLESFPGVSFVIGKTEEFENIKGKSRSYYFDLYTQWESIEKGFTPYTTPVQLVNAVDSAITQFMKEGYKDRTERYKALAQRAREGLKALGFELQLLSEGIQSNILTTVKMPEKMDYWVFHDKLFDRGITIYSDAGVLKKGLFRVATIGSITPDDIDWMLKNMREVLGEMGVI